MRPIDADALLRRVERWRDMICDTYGKNDEYANCLAEVVMKIEDAPTAEPRWIPVTERLPENFEEVNVTWVNTAIKDKYFNGTAVFYNGRWFWYSSVCRDYLLEYGECPIDEIDEMIKIIAWMPLPEPWKGADDATVH